jgi:hypothetical protein
MTRAPKLMSWFRVDSGGLDGTLQCMKEYKAIPAYPSLKFKEYDWTLDLGNFQGI